MGFVSAVVLIAAFLGIPLGILLILAGFSAMGWWGLLWIIPFVWCIRKGFRLYRRLQVWYDDHYDDAVMGRPW